MQFETCWGSGLAVCSNFGGDNGPEMSYQILHTRPSSPYPGNLSSQRSELQFDSLSLGSPFQHFPASYSMLAAAPCTYRSESFTSGSAGKEDKEFHFTGEATETSKESVLGFFFGKFRAEIRLGHRCPYSAACFLHKTLLSSALQMQVEVFWNRGEFLSDLPLFQLRL